MPPPASPPHPRQHLLPPIRPSPDSTPHQTLPFLHGLSRSAAAADGTRCDRRAPGRSRARFPPAPSSLLPKLSSHPPPKCVTGRELQHLTASYATSTPRSSH